MKYCTAGIDNFTTLRSLGAGLLGTAVVSNWAVCFINIR